MTIAKYRKLGPVVQAVQLQNPPQEDALKLLRRFGGEGTGGGGLDWQLATWEILPDGSVRLTYTYAQGLTYYTAKAGDWLVGNARVSNPDLSVVPDDKFRKIYKRIRAKAAKQPTEGTKQPDKQETKNAAKPIIQLGGTFYREL